ncbi:hypothetical protein MXB_2255 [Myxobolus squamalis]|nr:hypothetical protein MXB_2255 [Myxobolus squamalis]
MKKAVQQIIYNLKYRDFEKRNALRYIVDIMDMFYYNNIFLCKRSKQISHLILLKKYNISTNLFDCRNIKFRYKIKRDSLNSTYTAFFIFTYIRFQKCVNYTNKSNVKDIYFAKFMVDDIILLTNKSGIVNLEQNKSSYKHTRPLIHYIDDSSNGEYLIGGGICSEREYRFTNIWKYDPSENPGTIIPKAFFPTINYSKMTNDNKHIFGISIDFTTIMFDVETSSVIKNFSNPYMNSFPRLNTVVTDLSDNILLFNGNLYCTRSQKLIHQFLKFDPHLFGNFMQFDQKILINCQLWDLRNFSLLHVIDQFQDIIIKKTFNDDILLGIQYFAFGFKSRRKDNFQIASFEDHFYNWYHFWPTYGNLVTIYESRNFSQLGQIEYDYNLMFADISRDCTRILSGVN